MGSLLKLLAIALFAFVSVEEISAQVDVPDTGKSTSSVWNEALSCESGNLHEYPFRKLVCQSTSKSKNALDTEALVFVLNGLGERLKDLKECFTVNKLGDLVPSTSEISKDGFYNISKVLVNFVTRKECTGTASRTDVIEEPDIDQLMKSLTDLDYDGVEESEAYFNAFTLRRELKSNAQRFPITVILHLFQGACILPDKEFFLTEYNEQFKIKDGFTTQKSFGSLLSDLDIKGKDHHGEPNDGDEREEDEEEEDDKLDEDEEDRCYSATDFMQIYEIDGEITAKQALEMCPALVHQINSGACDTDKQITESFYTRPVGYTTAMIYGYGTIAIALLSSLAVMGFIFFPVLKTDSYKMIMQYFIGLGIGTMASDALMHIVPHVLGVGRIRNADGTKDRLWIWKMSVVLGGLCLFFFFENVLRLWKMKRDKRKFKKLACKDCEVCEGAPQSDDSMAKPSSSSSEENDVDTKDNKDSVAIVTGSKKTDENHEIVCRNFTTTCVCVFVGDVLHNFADGIAVGVAFSDSWTTGIGTTVAIFCHELPHELGDFAIYLKNGATKWQAVGMNLFAACCAFIGLFVGIAISSDAFVRTWLMCLVAGIFMYIALVQVMREMVRETTGRPILQFIIQMLGLLSGWVILLIVALYEHDIKNSLKK